MFCRNVGRASIRVLSTLGSLGIIRDISLITPPTNAPALSATKFTMLSISVSMPSSIRSAFSTSHLPTFFPISPITLRNPGMPFTIRLAISVNTAVAASATLSMLSSKALPNAESSVPARLVSWGSFSMPLLSPSPNSSPNASTRPSTPPSSKAFVSLPIACVPHFTKSLSDGVSLSDRVIFAPSNADFIIVN